MDNIPPREIKNSKFLFSRYTILFLQHAQKFKSAENRKLNASSADGGKGSKPMSSSTSSDSLSIGVFGLLDILSKAGPPVKEEQAKEFIYEYDSTLRGRLGLHDFLEFISDYAVVLKRSRDTAQRFYNTQIQLSSSANGQNNNDDGKGFMAEFPTVESYFESLNLDDPMKIIQTEIDPVTKCVQDAFWIDDSRLLNRQLSIRIFGVNNIHDAFRVKQRPNMIDYESIDPFVRVKCAGTTVDTTIIIGSTFPIWEQTLDLIIKIPKGSISDIQQWVQIQNIEFFIYDYNESCGTSSAELLYYASVPLIRVLLSTTRPLNALVELNKLDCQKSEKYRPEIEVSFMDQTEEKWSWTKVVDAYLSCEDIWLMKYADKMKYDLGTLTLPVTPTSEKDVTYLTEKIWKIFISSLETLKLLFPTRSYSLILLDEYNKFRFLSAFVQPIIDVGRNLETLDDLANAVAAIPFEQTALAPQWGTQEVIADHNERVDNVASWLTAGKPGTYATETFVSQTAEPSSILIRRRGNLIEHALLLCSLFRGKHVNAYVAIGEVKNRPYAWVITIITRNTLDTFLNENNPMIDKEKIPTPPPISEYEEDKTIHRFNQEKFLKVDMLLNEIAFRNNFSVLHWDPLSGACYENQQIDGTPIPFDTLNTLFNEKNMWFNVQFTNHVRHCLFSWDVENKKHWVPFLTNDMVIKPCQIQCPYAKPTFTDQFEFENDTTQKNHTLVTELVQLIQLYRRNILFIPETLFFRPVCQMIQSFMDGRSAGIIPIKTSKDGTVSSILGNMAAINFDVVSEKGHVQQFAHPCSFNSWWTSNDQLESLDQAATELLPPRHFWSGHVLQFSDNNKAQIFEQLVASGLLDISIPDTLFAIGVEISAKPFGMFSVRIVIGHIIDTLSQALNHLDKI